MREKKVRGIKRKINKLIELIEENTVEFPKYYDNEYRNFLLPVSQEFINSNKTPTKVKRQCIQTLIDRAKHLSYIKPIEEEKYRVVVAIYLPDLWRSEIIVFKGKSYYQDFFNRNDKQTWLPLSKTRNIEKEWRLSVPADMSIVGYREEITDEDYHYKGEIWFIGELN
ncbi:hypothetical protein JOC75_000510 [Metabacillus crassostreae]|uniref:DUF3916 domain-containing protein n=1 Tax=Metabacillus crassostreae TaxID=929098 RepID=UPI00195644E5|nr:DUF3916 domain-containing protein [Metabacillus crassostreae]MBM7602540.1 hypothetical protein [Metabacillus crassostreae]